MGIFRGILMGSKRQMGWGTLVLLASVLGYSSCSKSSKTDSEHELGPTLDFFQADCEASQTSGIVNGQKVFNFDSDSRRSVLLIIQDSSGAQHACSSTLISRSVLLTAAHCLKDAAKVEAVFYTDVSCSGGYSRSQDAILAADTTIHPLYNGDEPSMSEDAANPDLGLVHLSKPAPANYPIFKIEQNPESLQSDVYLYGYGITGTDKDDSLILRKTQVSRSDVTFNQNNMIIDQRNKTGICQGDSGGAGLMKDGNDLEIATVNSYVFSKDGNSDDFCNLFSGSVIVHNYMSWMSSTVSSWGENLK